MKKKILATSMLFCMALGLCACGTKTADTKETEKGTVPEVETLSGDTEKDQDGLIGSWELFGSRNNDGSFYPTENDINNEEFYNEANIEISKDGDDYKFDYAVSTLNGTIEYEGLTLAFSEGACLPNTQNQSWYMTVCHREEQEDTKEYVILEDMDTLIYCIEDTYHYTDTTEVEITCYYFTREGGDRDAEIDRYLYPDTIEVSTVEEFYNALGSDRKIELSAGTYNFSELADADKNNACVNDDTASDIYFSDQAACVLNVHNLLIEAKDGAEVEICTDDPLATPLVFCGCNRITLKGLTMGHHVEPGFCSGAVLGIWSSFHVTVDSCNLYGSGAYGIDGQSSSEITVTNCEIYECSQSLLYGSYCCDWYFTDTKFHDTQGINMLSFCYSWSYYFTDCTFADNSCSYGAEDFIWGLEDSDNICFTDCTFNNNAYAAFSDTGSITINNCNFDGEIINNL